MSDVWTPGGGCNEFADDDAKRSYCQGVTDFVEYLNNVFVFRHDIYLIKSAAKQFLEKKEEDYMCTDLF